MNIKVFTSAEVADRLGINPSVVCLYCRLGRLKAKKIGRDWLIAKDDLDSFAKKPRNVGNPTFKKG